MTIEPGELDFGKVTRGSPATETLTLRNAGRMAVTLNAATMVDQTVPVFTADQTFPLSLLSGQAISLTVTCSGDTDQLGPQSARLKLEFEDPKASDEHDFTMQLYVMDLAAKQVNQVTQGPRGRPESDLDGGAGGHPLKAWSPHERTQNLPFDGRADVRADIRTDRCFPHLLMFFECVPRATRPGPTLQLSSSAQRSHCSHRGCAGQRPLMP